ncbi:hypothetical protein GALL_484280 [mine drainage metagenome]|uniref:Uncharacterized protein n=1 Tax=mine drainage metagenome TaxID=410659 RepID=A0A1J5Q267_9ZZZZ
MRERGIDFQSFARLPLGSLGGDMLPGSSVMQPVGKFDDQHPDISGHRDDHLPDGLSFCGFPKSHSIKFGHPINQARYLVAEFLSKLIERVVGVLDRVVQ